MSTPQSAIFAADGKQWRVHAGQTLLMDKRSESVGTTLYFDQVLLLLEGEKSSIGTPHLANVQVVGKVLGAYRGAKVIVFKKQRRKGYQKRQGHRQLHAQVLIEKIIAPAGAAKGIELSTKKTTQ